MATGPKIVHKQFNSPMGLYSQQNIQETLGKHLQNLDNGTVGIDFNNPTTDKPGNLANSAVLRMLEEEERTRRGYPSQKKVVWPPVPETNGYHQTQQQSPHYNAQQSPSVQQRYQPESQQYQPQSQQFQPQYQPQNQYQQQQYPNQEPQGQQGPCEGRQQGTTGLSKLIPYGTGVSAAPAPAAPYRQGPTSPGVGSQPFRQPNSRWAPVPAPLSPQAYGSQPNYQQPQQQQFSPQPQSQFSPQPQSQFSPQPQSQFSPQPQSQFSQPQYSPQYSEPAYQPPQKQFEPPPSTITLRQQQPVHQRPPPVFPSQPATASFKGGVNMRGDQKWPPQTVKEAVEAENEARRQLAKGPACRPRKVRKDYTPFFAKHALNHNYPGYHVPPGTQHYEDLSGRSSY